MLIANNHNLYIINHGGFVFKVGQNIKEGNRIGRIVAIHSKGTADVLFDDMDYAIRRQSKNLQGINPIRRNTMRRKYGYPLRQNAETPIGVTMTEMRELIKQPLNEFVFEVGKSDKGRRAVFSQDYGNIEPRDMAEEFTFNIDDYIRLENVPKPKTRSTPDWLKDNMDKYAALYLSQSLRPRALFGTSQKTLKNDGSPTEVRVMYLQPAYRYKEVIMDVLSEWNNLPTDFNKKAEEKQLFPIKIGAMPLRKNTTCPYAGRCSLACLVASGRKGKESAVYAAQMKTWFWFLQPWAFLRQIVLEILKESYRGASYHEGGTIPSPFVFFARLNGTSDIAWERYLKMDKMFQDFQFTNQTTGMTWGLGGFYDYTKYPLDARAKAGEWFNSPISTKKQIAYRGSVGAAPESYDITFSINEQEGKKGIGKKPNYSSTQSARDWMDYGSRAAVVVSEFQHQVGTGKKGNIYKPYMRSGKMVNSFFFDTDYSDLKEFAINAPSAEKRGRYPLIVDGDETDFRFNDPQYSIVILKPKGLSVKADGEMYVQGSVFSDKKPVAMTAEDRGFIKDKKFVLKLQNDILKSLGEQPVKAQKPYRKKPPKGVKSPVGIVREIGRKVKGKVKKIAKRNPDMEIDLNKSKGNEFWVSGMDFELIEVMYDPKLKVYFMKNGYGLVDIDGQKTWKTKRALSSHLAKAGLKIGTYKHPEDDEDDRITVVIKK